MEIFFLSSGDREKAAERNSMQTFLFLSPAHISSQYKQKAYKN